MTQLISVIRVELLKLRRTLAFWLALLIPASIIGLQFFVYLRQGLPQLNIEYTGWQLIIQQTMVIWALVMLPLYITLQTALVAGVEHNQHTWKSLFTQPVPRWMIVLGKQFTNLLLFGIAMLVMFLLMPLMGLALRAIKPGIGISAQVPWLPLLKLCALVFAGGWLMTMINTWVAINWQNFVVAVGIGIITTVCGMFVIDSEIGPFYPWALPGGVANKFLSNGYDLQVVLFGLLGGVVMLIITNLLVCKKPVYK